MENIEWCENPKFSSNASRVENRVELEHLIEKALSAENAEHWYKLLQKNGIPVAVVRTVTQSLSHPQTIENGMVLDLEHPTAGIVKSLGLPISFDGKRGKETNLPPPLLGEHNEEILREFLGMSDKEIEQFTR